MASGNLEAKVILTVRTGASLDDVVQDYPEADRRRAGIERLHANQSAGDVLKHHLRSDTAELVKDEVFGDVQCSGD